MKDIILSGNKDEIPQDGKSLGEIYFNAFKELSDDNTIILRDETAKKSYTSANIFEQSVRVASRLHELGVRTNDVVGLLAENRIDVIWAILGCFYVGATLHPINPDYVTREIKHAFKICQPKFIIANSNLVKKVAEATKDCEKMPTLITFDDLIDEQTSLEQLEHNLRIASVDPESHVVWVLSSSGTTGLPKAVAITHEAVKHCLLRVRCMSEFAISEKETLLTVLPFYHIFGLLVVMTCLLCRARIIVLPKFQPNAFLQALETHKVTKLFIVPPLALFLAKTPIEFDATSLKDVICGAAPLGPEIQLTLESRLGARVRQLYGMTEASPVTLSPLGGAPAGSSGKLLANVQVKVLDPSTGISLGAHKRGELCVKSPCLMKCYLNNEMATRDVFDAQGFLHTGDIAYYDDEGFIYIVDRLKELIKYKGFQVPPAEIEDVLIAHADIEDAAVIGVEDERAGEKAKAFVVKVEGSNVTAEAIQQWVEKQLSNAKWLHGGVEFVQTIPKSAAGKILRKELKLLNGQRKTSESTYT